MLGHPSLKRDISAPGILSVEEACHILDTQREGIPFEAIRYLRGLAHAKSVKEKIIHALTHAYDERTYFDAEESRWSQAPLWYAIIAEECLERDLVDPIIGLLTATVDDWDFLSEEVGWLVGALGRRYPDFTLDRTKRAIDSLIDRETGLPYFYLFDVLQYADRDTCTPWILDTLRKNGEWQELLVIRVAALGIKEAIPIIEEQDARGAYDPWMRADIQELLEELRTGKTKYPQISRPNVETRDDWERHYRFLEHRFYDTDDEGSSLKGKAILRLPKEKIGRNDQCPCNSGKKYKKCHGA